MTSFRTAIPLVLLSIVLNSLFLAHDLPEVSHPDETAVVRRAMALGSGDLNPHYYRYPSLWTYMVFLVQALGAAVGLAIGLFKGKEDLATLAFSNPTYYFVVARVLAGILGAGAVWLTWRIGWRVSPLCAWASAAAVALFAPFVWQAHYATGDVPLVFFVMLCLAACIRALPASATRWMWLWQPAAAAGLATSIKYNGIVVFAAVATMLWLRWRREESSGWTYGTRLAASAAIASAFAAVTSPYVFLSVRGLAEAAHDVVIGTVIADVEHDSLAYVRIATGNWGLTFTLAAVAGWVVVFATAWGRRYRPLGWILGAFALPYLALIQYADYKAPRFLLPAVPVMAIGAGIALTRFSEVLTSRVRKALLPGAVALAVAGIALWPAVRTTIALERSFLQLTADLASGRWFRENVPPGATVFVDVGTNVNLAPDRETVEARLKLWQADPDARARQLSQAYRYYLKSPVPDRGYRLIPTNTYLLNTFQSGQDPERDYDTRRIDGVGYVIVGADRLRAPGDTARDTFYRHVRRTFCVREVFGDATGARIVVLERATDAGSDAVRCVRYEEELTKAG
jgi:hypothetical protein